MQYYLFKILICFSIVFSLLFISVIDTRSGNSAVFETNDSYSPEPNKLLKRQLFIDCKNKKFSIGKSKIYINGSITSNMDFSKFGKVWYEPENSHERNLIKKTCSANYRPEQVQSRSTKNYSDSEKGKQIHWRILDRYPKLDNKYRFPDLYGALTKSPLAAIYVPTSDWKTLSKKEKTLLASYIKHRVYRVKLMNPDGIGMTDESWAIIVGQLTPEQRDIRDDSIVLSGNNIKR